MKLIKISEKTKRKDIVFVLTQDLESPSGLGRYFPLAKNLIKQGLSVCIATLHSNYGALEQRQFTKEGIHVAYVAQMHVKKGNNTTKYFSPLSLIWISIKATWRLLKYVILNPANVIVIGKPHPMNSIAGLIGGHLMGAKIILDCDDYEAASNYFASSWQRWVVRTFENLTPKLVNKITTNTIYNQNRMVKLGVPAKKINYLPNGVDQERFQNTNQIKNIPTIESLQQKDNQIIAYIGSLNLDNHPVDLLLTAFRIIIEQISQVKLLIVGGGKDLNLLHNLAKDMNIDNDVIFVGRVSPDLVPHYYQIADVSVDPVNNTDAAKGRCPLKMFESWAMNTPFVTSDVGDRSFLAGKTQSTLLSEPGNPDDLAAKIISILRDPKQASLMRVSGSVRVKKFYWCNIVQNHLDIFKHPQ